MTKLGFTSYFTQFVYTHVQLFCTFYANSVNNYINIQWVHSGRTAKGKEQISSPGQILSDIDNKALDDSHSEN